MGGRGEREKQGRRVRERNQRKSGRQRDRNPERQRIRDGERHPRGEKVVGETHRGKWTERDKNRRTETVIETLRAQGEIKTETGERERNGDPQRW